MVQMGMLCKRVCCISGIELRVSSFRDCHQMRPSCQEPPLDLAPESDIHGCTILVEPPIITQAPVNLSISRITEAHALILVITDLGLLRESSLLWLESSKQNLTQHAQVCGLVDLSQACRCRCR
jgi:hypothetical protein